MGKLAAIGRSQVVSQALNDMNNRELIKLRQETIRNKIMQFKEEKARFNKPRDLENLMADIPEHAKPIYQQELRKSGFVNPDGTIRQGLWGQLQQKMQDPIIQAKIGQSEIMSIGKQYQTLKKIEAMRDPKQQKEALSKIGIKPEELKSARIQTGKNLEMTKWRWMPKMQEAKARMQQIAQNKAQSSALERMWREHNRNRAKKGLPPIDFPTFRQEAYKKDTTTSIITEMAMKGFTEQEIQKAINVSKGIDIE